MFLLAASATALFVGFLIPGEVAVILGGVLASRAPFSLAGILAASVAGPTAGDSIGYFIGRRYGENVSHRRVKHRWARAQHWIRTKGAPAVFFGRFVAFLRSFIPPAAGAARLPYRRFLPRNAAAGILWGTGSALLGYFGAVGLEDAGLWGGARGNLPLRRRRPPRRRPDLRQALPPPGVLAVNSYKIVLHGRGHDLPCRQ